MSVPVTLAVGVLTLWLVNERIAQEPLLSFLATVWRNGLLWRLALLNYAIDLVSWSLALRLFKRAETISGAYGSFRLLAGSMLQAGVCFLVSSVCALRWFFQPLIDAFAWSKSRDEPFDLGEVWSAMLHPVDSLNPVLSTGSAATRLPLSLMGAPTLLPPALLFLSVALCAALASSEPIVRRPLSLVLERMEESEKGVLTLLAVSIAALAGLMAAFDKAFS